MSACEECTKSCMTADDFEDAFGLAYWEWRTFQERKNSLSSEAFWVEFENFYNKYPLCVIEVLEDMLTDANRMGESLIKLKLER